VTVLVHMAVGAAVGSFVGGRGAAFTLGLLSHIPLDVIPHSEYEKTWLEVTVVAVAFGAMLVAGMGHTTAFWGAVGGAVPDVENLFWRMGLLPARRKMFPGHAPWLRRFVPHGRTLPARYAWWQVGIVGVALLVAARNLVA